MRQSSTPSGFVARSCRALTSITTPRPFATRWWRLKDSLSGSYCVSNQGSNCWPTLSK